MTLFSGPGADPCFIEIRDNADFWSAKKECLRLWTQFRETFESVRGKRKFCRDFSIQFQQMFWEMYLGVKLKHHYPGVKHPDSGPDFMIRGPTSVYVEATVAARGTGSDSVPELHKRDDSDDTVPFRECILRITNALDTKEKANSSPKYGDTNPYVVAINFPFPEPWLCGTPPLAAMAALGFTGAVIEWPSGRQRVDTRPELSKSNGTPVDTDGFWSSTYEHISALVLASVNIFSSAYGAPAVELLHNPNARNPLPKDWLPWGYEYWVDKNQLICERHE